MASGHAGSESHPSTRDRITQRRMPIDQLSAALSNLRWTFSSADPMAKWELHRRIAATGRKRGLITYSDLVAGVSFTLPTVNRGAPFQIDITDWSDLDRLVLGDFLGAISTDRYLRAGFLATAIVVNKQEWTPSDHFFKWIADLGVIKSRKPEDVIPFWIEQVNKAHDWYSANPGYGS